MFYQGSSVSSAFINVLSNEQCHYITYVVQARAKSSTTKHFLFYLTILYWTAWQQHKLGQVFTLSLQAGHVQILCCPGQKIANKYKIIFNWCAKKQNSLKYIFYDLVFFASSPWVAFSQRSIPQPLTLSVNKESRNRSERTSLSSNIHARVRIINWRKKVPNGVPYCCAVEFRYIIYWQDNRAGVRFPKIYWFCKLSICCDDGQTISAVYAKSENVFF